MSVVIKKLSEEGFRVVLVARGKDVLFDLLAGLPYEIVYLKPRKGKKDQKTQREKEMLKAKKKKQGKQNCLTW